MRASSEKVARDAIDRLEVIADRVASTGVDDVNDLVDWIDDRVDELEDRLDDPDDRGSDAPLHRGLYLVADTPATLHPVLTEDGGGDQGILTEMLAEEGVGTFGAARHEDELADFILETIDDLDDEHGAAIDAVIDQVAETNGLYTTLAVVHDMLRTGRVYAPTKTTLRTTGYEPDHERGLHA